MSPCSTCIHSRPVVYSKSRISCTKPALNRHLGTDPGSVTVTTASYFSPVNFDPAQVTACTGQTLIGSGNPGWELVPIP